MSDSDENWDDIDLGGFSDKFDSILPTELENPQTKQDDDNNLSFFAPEEDDEDWDDIGDDNQNIFATTAPMKLKGIKANPNAVEIFEDDDFDFKDETSFPLKNILQKVNDAGTLSFENILDLSKPTEKTTISSTHHQFYSNLLESFPLVSRKAENWDNDIQHFKDEEIQAKIEKIMENISKTKNLLEKSDFHFEIALCYKKLNRNIKALGSLKNTKQFQLESGKERPFFMIKLMNEIAAVQAETGDYFESIKSCRESLAKIEAILKNPKNLESKVKDSDIKAIKSRNQYQLAIAYLQTETHQKAAPFFAECISENSKLPSNLINWFQVGRSALFIGKFLLEFSNTENLSNDFIKKAIAASNEANDKETSSEATSLQFGNKKNNEKKEVTLDSLLNSDNESEENWDEEIGIKTNERVTLQLGVDDNSALGEKDVLMDPKYKILQTTEVEILSFPKATFFYTMKTKEKHTYMEEEFLQKWLGNITRKHVTKIFHNQNEPAFKEKNKYEFKEYFHITTEALEKFSQEWCEAYLEFSARFYFLEKFDLFWGVSLDFFKNVNQAPKQSYRNSTLIATVMLVLYLETKTSKDGKHPTFQFSLTTLEKLHPNASYLRTIIEVEGQIHHRGKDIKFLSDPLKKLCQIYEEISSKKVETTEDKDELSLFPVSNVQLRTRALLGIHSTLISVSPLNFSPLDFSSYQDDEEDSSSLSPLQEKLTTLVAKNSPHLSNATKRCEILTLIYPSIPPSILKAKVSYTLADHAIVELDDPNLAEQILFETIYILDLVGMKIPYLAPIVSELGTNSLLRYAEILLNNSKYPYAIAAMEQAIINYKLRKRPQGPEYHELLKQLAFLTQKNGDIDRASNYFKEMLDIYERNKKKNEARWVAETLCTMFAEGGDYVQSEIYINKALFLSGWDPTSTTGSERISPIVFRLLMKKAEVLLDSYKFERGIEVLETLLKVQLPGGTKDTVLGKLASSYTKKHMFYECNEILNVWEVEPTKKDAKSIAKNLKYYELAAKNEYQSRQYATALHHTETAIGLCDSGSLSFLADFYFLRGKIFQALCNSCTAVQFPTNLRPEKSPSNGNFVTSKLYSCTGDLIQEAVSCYDKAYDYYRAIGDDVNLAKVLSRIGELYLDRVFPPTSLLNIEYSEISRLRGFASGEVSGLVNVGRKRGHTRTFSDSRLPDFVISHEKIEAPARIAMEVAADTTNIMLTIKTYLNLAELRFVQDRKDSSLAFWNECKDLIVQLFFDGQEFILKDAPPFFIGKVLAHMRRLVRLLLAFEPPTINKNLMIIDALLLLEIEHDHAFERPMKPTRPEDYRSFTLGKSTGKRSGALRNEKASVVSIFGDEKSPKNDKNDKKEEKKKDETSPKVASKPESQNSHPQKKPKKTEFSELGEKIWGHLSSVKSGVQKYAQGKITQGELVANNRKILRKILQTRTKQDIETKEETLIKSSANLTKKTLSTSRRDLMNQKETETYKIHELQFTNRNFQKVLYALKIYDYLCFYAPLSGGKQIQRIGGKQETIGAISPSPTTSVPLNIHLLAKSEECVCLVTNSTSSLDSILKFLTNFSYWKEPTTKKSSGSFFGIKSSPSAPRGQLKYVSETEEFLKYLNKLLGELGYAPSQRNDDKVRDKPLTGNELELISFSKKTIDEFNSTQKVVPLLVNSSTTVAQCFTDREIRQATEENPLRLFLYLATNPIDFKFSKKNQKPIPLSEEILSYLGSLVKDTEENLDSKKTLAEFDELTFSVVNKMTLHSDLNEDSIEGVIPASYSSGVKKKISSPAPISLIISKSLQILPWEVFLNSLVVRFLSAQEIINCGKSTKVITNEITLPTYYATYHIGTDKFFQQEQEKRKDWLFHEMKAKLYTSNSSPSCLRILTTVPPLHSPLIKFGKKPEKAKFKHITWIDTTFLSNSKELLSLVEETSPSIFSTFLFTYPDLIGLPASLYHLIKSKPQYTYLFVPSSKAKAVTQKLMKYQDDCIKQKGKKSPLLTNQGRFHLLMTIVSQLQVDSHVPICVFNLYKNTD